MSVILKSKVNLKMWSCDNLPCERGWGIDGKVGESGGTGGVRGERQNIICESLAVIDKLNKFKFERCSLKFWRHSLMDLLKKNLPDNVD